MNDTTKVINTSDYLDKSEQVKMLAMHGKTMLMMYEATGKVRYLDRANADYHQAKSLLHSGFVRPFGVILREIA